MPDSRIVRHTPAVAAEHDVRAFNATTVMTVDNTLIKMPTVSEPHWDALAMLHGYGSRSGNTLEDLFNVAWAAANNPGALEIEIDESTDLFKITSTACRIKIMPLFGGDNELYGFPAEGDLAWAFAKLAANPWRRGVFNPDGGLRIEAEGHNSVDVPDATYRKRVQCLPVWLNERTQTGSAGSGDDVWKDLTLEDSLYTYLNVALPSAILNTMSLVIEADGRTSINYETSTALTLTTAAAGFWRLLGFSGRETPVSPATPNNNTRRTLTSEFRCVTFLAATSGYVRMRRVTQQRDKTVMMADGSGVTSGLAPLQGWELTVRAAGPAKGYDVDLEDHLRLFWPHAIRRLTVYPMWGDLDYEAGAIDVRRHRDASEVFGSPNLYGNTHTSGADVEANHWTRRKGGRLLVRRHPRDSARRIESYPNQALDAYQDLELLVYDDATR